MANSLLMLIKLNTDTLARLSLVFSIIAVIVSFVSALIALFAAFNSKRATAKGNLTRVKQNIQRPERVSNKVSNINTRMHQQEEQEALPAQAQRISISVEGESVGEVPLELLVTLQEPSVRVSRVERLTESGRALGSSPCKATDNARVFKSILAQGKVRQWWDAAESSSDGGARNVLRVYLLLDESGREVYRDVPVSIVEGLRNVGIADLIVWTIKGTL